MTNTGIEPIMSKSALSKNALSKNALRLERYFELIRERLADVERKRITGRVDVSFQVHEGGITGATFTNGEKLDIAK